jgi:hypothetical protein
MYLEYLTDIFTKLIFACLFKAESLVGNSVGQRPT